MGDRESPRRCGPVLRTDSIGVTHGGGAEPYAGYAFCVLVVIEIALAL